MNLLFHLLKFGFINLLIWFYGNSKICFGPSIIFKNYFFLKGSTYWWMSAVISENEALPAGNRTLRGKNDHKVRLSYPLLKLFHDPEYKFTNSKYERFLSYLLTHSFIHLLTHLYSLAYLLIHYFIQLLNYSLYLFNFRIHVNPSIYKINNFLCESELNHLDQLATQYNSQFKVINSIFTTHSLTYSFIHSFIHLLAFLHWK